MCDVIEIEEIGSQVAIECCPSCGWAGMQAAHDQAGAYDIEPWSIDCPGCQMSGPRCATEEAAIVAWNALPRREEFHSRLVKMGEIYREASIEPGVSFRLKSLYLAITTLFQHLAKHYAPKDEPEAVPQ